MPRAVSLGAIGSKQNWRLPQHHYEVVRIDTRLLSNELAPFANPRN